MEFSNGQPIYLQISDMILEKILRKDWTAGMKIPSIREIATEMEVNPNTVVRTYNFLQESGMVQNRRGIGYYVTEDARERTLSDLKTRFLTVELPEVVRKMHLLRIGMDELHQAYQNYNEKDLDHEDK